MIGEMLGAADGDSVTIGRLRAPPSYSDALSSDARPALSAATPELAAVVTPTKKVRVANR